MAAVSPIAKERLRHGSLAKPAERADLYWSREQRELKGITDGEVTALMIETPEFQEVFGPKLEAIDRRNRTIGKGKNMGRPLRWTALQLESVFLFRRIAGTETLKGAWERLHSQPATCLLLGLGEQIPSRPTLCRYVRQHFDEDARAEAHLELDKRLRQRVAQASGFDNECRILGMDGSIHGTHFTAPIPNSKQRKQKEKDAGRTPRKIVNDHIPAGEPRAITAPTAGFIGGHHAKSGRGWQMLGLWSEHGTLLGWDISPLNENEKPAAERVLESYERDILPHRGSQTLSVLTADCGFNSASVRRQIQTMRAVPNIHKASHKAIPGKPDDVTREAKRRNETWYRFRYPGKPHYENWMANGHAEIRCSCGAGKLKSIREVGKSGAAIMATKGCCSTCGNVTITSGCWKRPLPKSSDGNKRYYVRCYREDKADPSIGNSLTYNDALSKVYGQDRFGWGESIHATLRKRFGLLKDKSWMRDITEVKTEFAIAGSAISVLLLERNARKNAPPLPLAPPVSSGSRSGQAAALPLAA
jgi:hypothetical protein